MIDHHFTSPHSKSELSCATFSGPLLSTCQPNLFSYWGQAWLFPFSLLKNISLFPFFRQSNLEHVGCRTWSSETTSQRNVGLGPLAYKPYIL